MSRFSTLFTGDANQAGTVVSAPIHYKLLLVDDEPNVLNALRRVFRQENYQITTVASGDAALEILKKERFQLLITDHHMPGLTNGAELLKRARELCPDMLRIMLTGQADSNAVMGAVKDGMVYRFILKPWNDDDLRVSVALALEQYDLLQKNKSLQRDNVRLTKDVGLLSKMAVNNRSQLAVMLNKRGALNDRQMQELYNLQQGRKEPMIQLLFEKDWLSETEIYDLLRKELMLEEVSLAEFQVDQAVTDLIPKRFCLKQWVVPLKLQGRRLMLAVADPLDTGLVDDVRFVTGLDVQTVLADVKSIQAKINALYPAGGVSDIGDLEAIVPSVDPYEGIEVVIEDEDDCSLHELLRSTEEPPAIRLVNAVITEALRLRASDIHIQPRTKGVIVRYRIDGVLHDKIHIPHYLYTSMVARIKVMAELDLAERRRPQDGRITVKTPMRIADLRISMLPTVTGEKIVMRILDRNAAIHRIEDLGFAPEDQARVLNIVTRPSGIILATGPTGSGKTTTLYSLLQHDADASKNYLTIEDPVEFFMDMAGQVHIKDKIGLTFPAVLRAILRQDPDVILLGEVRDFETAEVAFHAALTGHLVFSTLHTNSAPATIARLLDLGLKPYVIATALEGIIAQRLVRKVCSECSEPVTPDAKVQAQLGALFKNVEQVWRGRGCQACNQTGLSGRIGIYEVLVPDGNMRELIAGGASVLEITRRAKGLGMADLMDDAYRKVKQGLTTMEEVLRVFGAQSA